MKLILLALSLVGLLTACSTVAASSTSAAVDTYAPVTGASPLPESLLGFSVNVQSINYRAVVNRFTHAVTLYLPPGTNVTSLTPSLSMATGVTATPSGAQDFTSPVTYKLSDGTSYTVTVNLTVPTAAQVNTWLGTGINLGNDLDAWPGDEGSWTQGVVAQKTFFDDYKNLGFSSVRIPITWGMAANPSDRLSDTSPFSVNPAFMARVDQVAGWGIDAGLTVVINAHHENWIRTLTGAAMTAQLPRFEALWTQIAQHFAGWPPQLVFEILNEPQPPSGSSTGGMTNADLKVLNQDILNIIRKYDPTRVVIVGADQWNSLSSLVSGTFSLPSDPAAGGPYLIATFHNYMPWSFAGQSSGTWGSSSDIASMKAQLDVAAAWGKQNNVPIYMGEYGVTHQYNGTSTDPASRITWYTQVTQLARADGISMALWDDYGDFKLYDRVNRTFESTVLKAVNP